MPVDGEEREVNFLKKISVDFSLILPLVVITSFVAQYFTPFRRGFYCFDTTIMYPLKEMTVSNVSLYLISLGFPLIFLGMGEILFASEVDYENDLHHHIFKWSLPKAFVRTYDISISFLFGYLVCILIILLSQLGLGVLRPNFVASCQPNINCLNSSMILYHENYTCQNDSLEAYSRISFPSKHTTLCFYTMVYLSVYLQNKVRWEYLSVFNNCMQVTFMIVAWLVSVTQITDYHHHLNDVIAGIVIGSLVAWFNVCAVYNFFKSGLRMPRG